MRPEIEALEHHAELGADAVDLPAVGRLHAGRRGAGAWRSVSPATTTSPASGVSSRLMQRRNVDLPEPLEPRIEMTSPSLARQRNALQHLERAERLVDV